MRKKRILLEIIGAILVFTVFLRCWNYGIINLDDYLYLTAYKPIYDWAGWESIKHFFTNVEEGIWMPLTWFSYAIDYILWDDWFGGFHLHSIFIHSINFVLVWRLLLVIFEGMIPNAKRNWICLFAALIWAIHPLRCESVVFVASRKDVLSFFWELIALIFWVKGSSRNAASNKSTFHTTVSVICFIIASMCKPSVMTFPILCFLIDAFVYRNVKGLRYIAPVGYMLFLGVFAAWQQTCGGATEDIFAQPLWGRILGACAAFGIYLRNFFWPQWLAPQCIKTWPDFPRFWLPGIAISLIWGLYLMRRFLYYWSNRDKLITIERWQNMPVVAKGTFSPDYILLGASWYAVALAPMLGIANFGYHAYADRFTYIPSVGLSILIVIVFNVALSYLSRIIVLIISGIVIISLSACTWHQTSFWENDYKLFKRTLEVDGEHNACAYGILANWYFEFPHDLEKSVEYFEKAIDKDIRYVLSCYELYIFALCELGRTDVVGEKLKKYEDVITSVLGNEKAAKIWTGDPAISNRERVILSLYQCSKLAWWLTDKKMISSAEELMKEMRKNTDEDDPIWLYLEWRYYLLKGDKAKADYFLNKLKNPTRESGYCRFRYLREIKSTADSE